MPANCQSRPTVPMKAAPVSWLLLMSYTSNPPFLLLRNKRSVSPGMPLKLPTPENCQSSPDPPPLKWSDLRYVFDIQEDCNGKERLTADIIELDQQYGRYGYRKVAGLLRQAGWIINDKRVERIWRREGLKVPHKQPKRGRLWLADGSCIRLRPQHRNHVWSYDFVEDRTHDGRRYRMLNVIDEFTHECLATRVARKLKAIDVIDVLSDLFILRGVPGHIRSDNGPEFVAEAVQAWITAVGAKTAYIERGSPWENGYVESFNARLRDELLNGEIFYTLREAQIVIESWRRHYNTIRPHASLGYKPPAPEVFLPAFAAWPAALPRPASPATLAQRPTLN